MTRISVDMSVFVGAARAYRTGKESAKGDRNPTEDDKGEAKHWRHGKLGVLVGETRQLKMSVDRKDRRSRRSIPTGLLRMRRRR